MSTRGQSAPAGSAARIRAAVIGCRNRGWQVAGTFKKIGRFDVVALCDCDAASLDAAMGHLKSALPVQPRFEKDFRRVLDDKSIDAVVVATPDHWHALMTVMALDAGKHVYLEKPASYNIDEGKAIVAARKRHPKQVVAIGTQHRSGRHFQEAKAFIDGGGVGKIGFVRAWMVSERPVVGPVPDSDPPAGLDYDLWVGPAPMRPYNSEKLHYNWHFMRDYGTGDAGNWGAHWLDTARWLAGLDLPRAVVGLGGQYIVKDGKEWPDTQMVLYEFPHLTLAWEVRQWSNYGVNGRGIGTEIGGDKGSVVIDRSGWTFHPLDKKAKPVQHGGSALEEPHAHNFADCITDGAKPAADAVEGHKSAILCHLANIATGVHRRIEFDPATETIRNDPEAARWMGRPYRSPWTMPPIT